MATMTTGLAGVSMVAGGAAYAHGMTFRGVNPASGAELEPAFHAATPEQVDAAARAAEAAAPVFAATTGPERARFLRAVADALQARGEAIIARANAETGLPIARLTGELGRTTGQLRLFAEVVEEGSWVDARIDLAMPDRKPLPRQDLRSMLRPLGPVAVFGASNFPLAFSVLGGDTASALAAGCPVVVKAHPAHPGTSELAGQAIREAVGEAGLPPGVFSLLFDAGIEVGVALVKHPAIKAVAFTGSQGGGVALMRLAQSRPEPIPCYAEMGSTNPLFILPGALRERGQQLAEGLKGSFTLGSGQFCTKPGLVFVPRGDSETFRFALQSQVDTLGGHCMLTPGIAAKYNQSVQARLNEGVAEFAGGQQAIPEGPAAATHPAVFALDLQQFQAAPHMEEEIFGPTTLLVRYGATAELIGTAQALHGHLTATIHGTAEDLAAPETAALVRVLETRVGRILYNGYPTGVEVCHAMVHGGPFPSTSDTRTTSVGTRAMLRFARPVCYQDSPMPLLPAELRDGNPAGILRMVNGVTERH